MGSDKEKSWVECVLCEWADVVSHDGTRRGMEGGGREAGEEEGEGKT